MFAARQAIGTIQRRAFSVSARDVSLDSTCQCLAPHRQILIVSRVGLQGRRPRCRWWYWPASVASLEAQPQSH